MAAVAAMGLESVNGDALWVRATRWLLFSTMVALFLFQNFVYWGVSSTWWATEVWSNVVQKYLDTKHLDKTEGKQLFTTVPLILIVVLAPIYLALPKPRKPLPDVAKESKPPSAFVRLWNRILFVNGPLGVFTVKELFWCLYVLALVMFVVSKYMDRQLNRIDSNRKKYPKDIAEYRIRYLAQYFGIAAMPLINLLFLPVARGSVLLRLINMPFEKAIKYHRWLGVAVIVLLVMHGGGFWIHFIQDGNFWEEAFTWKDKGINALLGWIAVMSALVMLFSSLSYVRRRHYDTFFRLHHLYIVFIAFSAMHLGEWFWRYTVPGIFLFALDRYQRFLQSRRNASVLATRTMPDGTVQVEVLKSPLVVTSPLQVLWVKFPWVSKFQAHPFSLGSHHRDSATSFVFHVKNLGTWTNDMCQMVGNSSSVHPQFASFKKGADTNDFLSPKADTVSPPRSPSRCPFSSVKVEGFYGGNETYFLRYPALVIVAGGSGMVPLAPVIRDLLHRHAAGEEVGLPSHVTVIFAVKTHAQLAPLADIAPEQLCPGASSKLQIDVQAYVTQEDESMRSSKLFPATNVISSDAEPKPMLPHVGNLNNGLQESFYLLCVFLGTFLCYYITISCFIDHYDNANNNKLSVWRRGLWYLVALVVGVVLSSSLASAVLYLANGVFAKSDGNKARSVLLTKGVDLEDTLLQRAAVTFGQRPLLDNAFATVCKKFAGSRVGVLSSGPESLNLSVAEQCRKRNGGIFDNDSCYLSFHSVSFEL